MTIKPASTLEEVPKYSNVVISQVTGYASAIQLERCLVLSFITTITTSAIVRSQ